MCLFLFVQYSVGVKYIVGIDEVGRGPIAGPVTVGCVCVHEDVLATLDLRGLRDSKQLSPRKREAWFSQIQEWVCDGSVVALTSSVKASTIDRVGISHALAMAISRVLSKLPYGPDSVSVRLDGRLRAPLIFHDQRTIIRGDQTDPCIMLAALYAKVVRDRTMVRLGRRYPDYGFEKHKGYGTRFHYEMIKKYGLTDYHRRTWISIDR